MTITKAVIPVAGMGTRFLPATLSVSKVMIPIVDRPSIHYGIEELHQAGITEIIFIISPDQKSIKDYVAGKFPYLSLAGSGLGRQRQQTVHREGRKQL